MGSKRIISAGNLAIGAQLEGDCARSSGFQTDAARAEVSAIGKQLKQEFGKDMDTVDFTAVPQQEYLVGNVRRP